MYGTLGLSFSSYKYRPASKESPRKTLCSFRVTLVLSLSLSLPRVSRARSLSRCFSLSSSLSLSSSHSLSLSSLSHSSISFFISVYACAGCAYNDMMHAWRVVEGLEGSTTSYAPLRQCNVILHCHTTFFTFNFSLPLPHPT